MAAITPPQIGDVFLAKLRVEAVLGQGGMGTVLAVRHLELDERFALKLLRVDDPDSGGELSTRFKREARVGAKVKSPHVAAVFDAGTLPGGESYLVMEYLAGSDLFDWVEDHGPMSSERAADVAMQICLGLAAVHAEGFVHRDLKPENVFLAEQPTGDATVKILDFGIAKVPVSSTTPHEARALTTVTGAMGTPPYLPPEQIVDPQSADVRADIYAVGGILYRVLTGRDAFEGPTTEAVLSTILTTKPAPLASHRPGVSRALEKVVLKCLAKERSGRYQHVADLAQDLAPILGGEGWDRAREVASRLGAGPGTPTPPSGALARQATRAKGDRSPRAAGPPVVSPSPAPVYMSQPPPGKERTELPDLPRTSLWRGFGLAVGAAFLAGISYCAYVEPDEEAAAAVSGAAAVAASAAEVSAADPLDMGPEETSADTTAEPVATASAEVNEDADAGADEDAQPAPVAKPSGGAPTSGAQNPNANPSGQAPAASASAPASTATKTSQDAEPTAEGLFDDRE